MIRHIVLMKVQENSSATAQLQQAFEQIRRVVDRLPGALAVDGGPSRSPEHLERGYTHGLVIDFADRQALRAYADDQEHRAAGAMIVNAAVGGEDGLLVVDLEMS